MLMAWYDGIDVQDVCCRGAVVRLQKKLANWLQHDSVKRLCV